MSADQAGDVTHVLSAIERGEPQAAEQLLPLVYDELRRLAAQRLAQERPGQTLQATALVHEAYLRLVGDDASAQRWNGRTHFLAAAAESMRRILIDGARRKKTAKRGGGQRALSLDGVDAIDAGFDLPPEELLALDEALKKFAQEDPVKGELVKLRYFGGLSIVEAAEVLGISRGTAVRYWDYARTWLYSELNPPDEPKSGDH
jgi:RNA polymerase sigma factor (TIGR02999 family)